MKVLFAADGSTFTKKALTFLVGNKNLLGKGDELVVVHVQDAVSANIERKLGSAEVAAYQAKQADAILKPIKRFLDKHTINYRCLWVVGTAAGQIIDISKRERVQMVVMGAHGHGLLSRMFMGSVAQRVLAESDIPTLLIK
jgi:nucleotide-binding universal stress UspA family protein